MSVRIIVADPLELIAEGVRSWLAPEKDLVVVGHVSDGVTLAGQVGGMACDLVLLEVSMPGKDGIDAMRELRRSNKELLVMAHTALTDIEYVNSMFIEGANGYLVKGVDREEFVRALRTVVDGQRYVSGAARKSMESGYMFTEKRPDGEYIGLTQREREIIRMVALERTNGEIADALFISEDTVKTHRKNLMTKLNVRSVAGLVKYAIDRRWI